MNIYVGNLPYGINRDQLRDAFAVYGEDGRPFVPSGESTVFVGGGQPGFAKTVFVQVPHGNTRKR